MWKNNSYYSWLPCFRLANMILGPCIHWKGAKLGNCLLNFFCNVFASLLLLLLFPGSICLSNANDGNTRTIRKICAKFRCLYCQLWTNSRHCSGVCIVDCEQVNAGWVAVIIFAKLSKEIFFFLSGFSFTNTHCSLDSRGRERLFL